MPNSFKRAATLFGLAGFLLLATTSQALNFTWSFTNTTGNIGLSTDVVSGTVLGLNEGGNWAGVTVTFDEVNGSPAVAPIPATSFTGSWFVVTGGVITAFDYSANNGTYSIRLSGTGSEFVAANPLDGQSPFYGAGAGEVAFTPLSVPDGGITLILLGLGLSGLYILRRKLT